MTCRPTTAIPDTPATVEALPREPGAYALVIRLDSALGLDMPRFRGRTLPAGLYAYFGSARGSGGLAGRVGRHLRPSRRPRWHVDRLLAAGEIVAVLTWPGGDECLWRAGAQTARSAVPLRGFGSSDCRICPAHLLAVDTIEAVRAGCPNGDAVGGGRGGA